MKIKVKTLTGGATEFDIEPSDTVLALKTKVAEKHGADVSAVRLAFSGRVLNNNDTIEDSHVKDGDTLIAVIPRSKVVAKPATAPAPQPDPVPQPAEPAAPAPAPAPAPSQEEKPAAPAPEQPAQPAEPAQPAPAPVRPQQPEGSEEDIGKLEAMGFPRDECVRALRLAYGNADRAVQFLLEGFPSEPQEPDEPDEGDEGEGVSMTSAEVFQRLTADPQFQQLRTALQANPMLLESVLNQMKQANPLVYNVIMDNREAFSQWLSDSSSGSPAPAPVPGAGAGAPQQPRAPAGPRIELSAEDRAAIQQLVDMGFDQGDALQAYMACEKNLQLAANFLMENGGFGF